MYSVLPVRDLDLYRSYNDFLFTPSEGFSYYVPSVKDLLV